MEEFLHQLDEDRIVAAIGAAEAESTAEIRVHVEKHCREDVLDRAVEVFANLHMHQTRYRNGVLIYIACYDHKFAIIGDAGINAKVGANFWDQERALMAQHFKRDEFTEGVCKAIEEVAKILKVHFPFESGDINELPDNISFGD